MKRFGILPRLFILVVLPGLAPGCATLGDRGQPLVPTKYRTQSGPFVIFTGYPLPADEGVVKGLNTLRGEFEDTLGLKSGGDPLSIEVYILDDRKAFEHFLTFYYPELPQRRAFFIAQGTRRVVYTFRGERLEEDLRHEATHALLHAAVGSTPLWLDEGLAEYFEVGGAQGRNSQHLARLIEDLRGGWNPDMKRLEGLASVREMSPRDYRESWAWVHFLLHGSSEGRVALLGYLGDLRKTDRPRPVSEQLARPREETLRSIKAHLAKLNESPTPKADPAPSVRLQDGTDEIGSISAPPKKRGLIGRLFGRLSAPGP